MHTQPDLRSPDPVMDAFGTDGFATVVRVDTDATVLAITGAVRSAAVEELGALVDRAASLTAGPVVVDLRGADLDRGTTAALRDRCPDVRLDLPPLRSLPGAEHAGTDPQPGAVHVSTRSSRAVVILAGEIDAGLSGDLHAAAQQALGSALPVDVMASEVTFADSTGLRFLLRLATGSRHRPRLVRPSAQVAFVVGLTELGGMLDTVRPTGGRPRSMLDPAVPPGPGRA